MLIVFIFCAFIVGAIPLIFLIRLMSRKHGSSIALLCPLSAFLVAYIILGFVRPLLYVNYNWSYDFTELDNDQYFLSLAIIAICNYFMCLGYWYGTRKTKILGTVTTQKQPALILLGLAILFMSIAYVHAASNGIISGDFYANRDAYLRALQGSGYVSFFYIYPGLFLLWCYWVKGGRGYNYIIFLTLFGYIVLNVAVSNRSMLTIVLYGFFLVSQIKKYRDARVGAFKIFLALVGLVVLGVIVGLSRGVDNVDIDLNVTLLALNFLSATFDMQEMFAHVLSTRSLHTFYYGGSWFQDVILTYIPRAIFTFKPELYGSTLLEYEVLGRELSAIGLATFPLGIYGEGYLNFWYFGVIFVVFFTGYILGFLFSSILGHGMSGPTIYNFWPVFIYLATSANTLGYLRSFGQYISGIIFSVGVFSLVVMCIWLWKSFFKYFNVRPRAAS